MNEEELKIRHRLISAEQAYVSSLTEVLNRLLDVLNKEHYLVDAEYEWANLVLRKLKGEENAGNR